MMKRFSDVLRGYDCVRFPCGKGRCGKDAAGNHGICADEWIYAVSDGIVALSIKMFSATFPASVPITARTPKEPRGNIMHVHTAFPLERESMRLAHSGLPEDEVRALLGGNSAAFYDFDLEKLAPYAARAAVMPKDVAEPLTEIPEGVTSPNLRKALYEKKAAGTS